MIPARQDWPDLNSRQKGENLYHLVEVAVGFADMLSNFWGVVRRSNGAAFKELIRAKSKLMQQSQRWHAPCLGLDESEEIRTPKGNLLIGARHGLARCADIRVGETPQDTR
jgi:hypothetical protein